jgi:hypothetical protein
MIPILGRTFKQYDLANLSVKSETLARDVAPLRKGFLVRNLRREIPHVLRVLRQFPVRISTLTLVGRHYLGVDEAKGLNWVLSALSVTVILRVRSRIDRMS